MTFPATHLHPAPDPPVAAVSLSASPQQAVCQNPLPVAETLSPQAVATGLSIIDGNGPIPESGFPAHEQIEQGGNRPCNYEEFAALDTLSNGEGSHSQQNILGRLEATTGMHSTAPYIVADRLKT